MKIKRREENIAKTKFEGAYLSDGCSDLTQIWNGRCPTQGSFHSKKDYGYMKTEFSSVVPVKYTLVCCSPTLGEHLVAQYAIVCLDMYCHPFPHPFKLQKYTTQNAHQSFNKMQWSGLSLGPGNDSACYQNP